MVLRRVAGARCAVLAVALALLERSAGLVPAASVRSVPTVAAAAATAAPEAVAVDLTPAERARTTADLGVAYGAGLSTLARGGGDAPAGAPFGTHADYVLDGEGCPVLLIDGARAEHAKNLAENDECSALLVARRPGLGAAAVPRTTVVGRVSRVAADADDRAALEAAFGVTHPYADDLLGGDGGGDFDLWRLEPSAVYFVGGFGVAAQWVDVDDYADAAADAVAREAADLCVTLGDARRARDLETAAKLFCGVPDPAAVSVSVVDRLGLDLRVVAAGGATAEFRIAFRAAARSAEDAKSEINKLLQEAWEADQGLEWDGAYESAPVVLKRTGGDA